MAWRSFGTVLGLAPLGPRAPLMRGPEGARDMHRFARALYFDRLRYMRQDTTCLHLPSAADMVMMLGVP